MATQGLRERKAARTRAQISRVAIGLFCSRGFDAVTMTQVAHEAEVGRATLFAYFPTKEDLVLERVRGNGPVQTVRQRAAGVSLVDALRAHCHETAARFARTDQGDVQGTRRVMGLILSTPVLRAGLQRLFDQQREDLAGLLSGEDPGLAGTWRAEVAAAQAMGVVLAVESHIYRWFVSGEPTDATPAPLAGEIDVAFDQLAAGLERCYPKRDD